MSDDNDSSETWGGDDSDDDIPDVPDIETVEQADEMLPNADGTDDESTLSAVGDGVASGIDTDRIGSAAERGSEAVTSAASATAYAGGLASGLAGVMLKTAKLIPKQSTLFRKLAINGMKGYYKRSGADALGIEARPNGELDLVPVSYLASEVTDEGQRPGWQVHGRDRSYDAASMGDSVHYLKDTPLVPLHSDATVESTWMAPRIAEAVELDQYWPLFNNAEINPIFEVPRGQGENPGEVTYADGGQVDMRNQFRGFEVTDPGHYAEDAVVDLQSDDGRDGMRISFSKAQDILDERTTSERMDMQEQRGRIMSQLQGGKEAYAMKMLIIAATAIVLSILAVVIGPELVGGGGGGGINPLLAVPLGV
jgi:hypothetical protein